MSGHDSKYFSTTKKGEIPELKEELNSQYKVIRFFTLRIVGSRSVSLRFELLLKLLFDFFEFCLNAVVGFQNCSDPVRVVNLLSVLFGAGETDGNEKKICSFVFRFFS